MTKRVLFWVSCCALVWGCSNADGGEGEDGSSVEGVNLAQCPEDPGEGASLAELDALPAYGVVATDFTVASVSLLDEQGEPLQLDWIDSGATEAGLVTTLSGDIILPTQPSDPCVLPILDRFSVDVLTRILMPGGRVLGQLKTHTPADEETETGFSSNPHDYVYVDEQTAYVTRHGVNLDPSAPDIDQGNDLLIVDPSAMQRVDRIDLSSLNGEAMRPLEDGGSESVTTYARPDRMLRVGDHLAVGLGRLSVEFDAASEGRLAIVDIEDGSVEALELPGLSNCGQVAPVPGPGDQVVVGCIGFSNPTGDPEQVRDSAGIALVTFTGDGQAEISELWRASEHPDAPVTVEWVTSLGGTRVVAGVYGDFVAETPDRVFVVDLASGEQTLLFETTGQFQIGPGVFEPDSGLLLLPDGQPRVRRFRMTEDGPEEMGESDLSAGIGLPVTGVFPLR